MIRRALIGLIIEALDQKEVRDLRRLHRWHDLKNDHFAKCKREGLTLNQARIRWSERQAREIEAKRYTARR